MTSEDGEPEELRIVLFGDSGSGKSAAGNTILRKGAFTSRQSWLPTTLTCQTERGEFEGTTVSVVDTPWTIRHNTTEKLKCISYCSPGPHAFLVVILLKRFTDVDRQLKILQWLFGGEVSRYTIVLFTHGDKLPVGVTTEQFINQNPVPYGVEYHLFNNRDRDPSQVRELLEKINRMVRRNGGSYCIKVKDWKQKYLYPLASAVTIGGSIGAASGGTGLGVVVAVVGSAVGGIAAGVGGNRGVYVAAVTAAVGAVAGAGVVAVGGFVLITFVSILLLFGLPIVLGALAVSGAEYFVSAVAFCVAAVVALIDAGVVDQDALGAGVAIGARNAARVAAAIYAGSDTVGAAYEVFDDLNGDEVGICEMFIIVGGAAVGAGLSAPDGGPYTLDLPVDELAADFADCIGVLLLLSALLAIAAGAKNRIAGLVIFAVVSVGAAVGAAAGVLGASGFAIGVMISVACQTVTRWLNRNDRVHVMWH